MIRRIDNVGDDWRRTIAQLVAAGVPVPLPARAEFAARLGGPAPRLLVLEEDDGRASAAIAFDVEPGGAIPGHRIARAYHCGAGLVGPKGDELLAGLADLARAEFRLLRLTVEIVLRDPSEHARLTEGMRMAGFAPLEPIRKYHNTLVIDLGVCEDQILRSFSTSTRRDLRGWAERPVELREITDVRYAERLNALARETFLRTGGEFTTRPWAERIGLCRDLPSASRLVGIFRAGRDDPEALLAYAWGCAHGDHAHYDDGGSTRADDYKASLMYPLIWDLVRWAKQQGCQWFDMGGVTLTTQADGDPLGGISDFKRRFSKTVVAVGAEWVLEPHPRRAALVRGLGRVATRLGVR